MTDERLELCACGKPLHYTDAQLERVMRLLVRRQGPDVVVHCGEGGWRVPRHYIALHGLRAEELPELAERLGFPELTEEG